MRIVKESYRVTIIDKNGQGIWLRAKTMKELVEKVDEFFMCRKATDYSYLIYEVILTDANRTVQKTLIKIEKTRC